MMGSMQDFIAAACAVAAAAWLVRSLTKRFFAPPCSPPSVPGGGDGFVSIDALAHTATAHKDLTKRRSP